MKLLDPGKVHDLVEFGVDLALLHAQNGAVEINILAAGEVGVEPGADFQQARHPAVNRARPAVGSVIRQRIFKKVLCPRRSGR